MVLHCVAGQWCHPYLFFIVGFCLFLLGFSGGWGFGGEVGGVRAVGFFHAIKGSDRSRSRYYRKAAISRTYCQKVNCL